MEKEQNKFGVSSFTLHTIAMLTMLIDHIYFTIFLNATWMNGIGRLAFPIFAFMIVEGYYHTKNIKNYILRLLIFAIISEIPFNIMVGYKLFLPQYQNVIWTFLISLCGIVAIGKVKEKFKRNQTAVFILNTIIAVCAFLVAQMLRTDYLGYGVMTVFTFYFFRGKKLWQILGKIVMMLLINGVLLRSMSSPLINIGEITVPLQILAVLSLVIIELYNGERGYHNKFIKYLFYIFYPLHMLILGIISIWLYINGIILQ